MALERAGRKRNCDQGRLRGSTAALSGRVAAPARTARRSLLVWQAWRRNPGRIVNTGDFASQLIRVRTELEVCGVEIGRST